MAEAEVASTAEVSTEADSTGRLPRRVSAVSIGGFHGGFANRGFAFRHDHFRRGFFPFFGVGAGSPTREPIRITTTMTTPIPITTRYCYLHRQWVWNGYRHVYALVRVCP